MTKLERTMGIIVSFIVALSLTISVTVSIMFGAAQNDSTFQRVVEIGMNVLNSEMRDSVNTLHIKADMMLADGKVASTLKRGFVGDLNEKFINADFAENVYCMYTDAEGEMIWKSGNYVLEKYDVSAALEKDEIVAGFYSDKNVPLSAVYIAPIKYRGGDSYTTVGVLFLGCELSSDAELLDIKTSTECELALYSVSRDGAVSAATTIPNEGEDVMPQEAIDTILRRESFEADVDIGHRTYMARYDPVTDVYGKVVGAAMSAMSAEPKRQAKAFMITTLIGVALLIIPLAFFLVMMMLRRIAVGPIVEAGLQVQGMNRGDLSVPDIDESKLPKNEIGEFTRRLQDTKHTLSAYISDISRILDAMAEGDFTKSADLEYMGDFTQIQQSFERIRDRLSGIVREIDRSSEDVYVGSEQMAAGSQVLADGTVTQAAAMEELSGKISSVLEKTRRNAKNAFRASELSNSMESSSVEQNDAMQRLTEAMEDISRRSAEISNIIKTIDSIAFQTNILALNAAVEAARAGAAGKGFAVVADEVRNLASKSADAVKETTDLITATADAVAAGRELVNAATSSMGEITHRAEETSRLVNAISAGSAEQARDIDMINDALGRISDVISQNSATAEESAASCQQLATRSRVRKDQVKVLKA